MPDAEFDRDTVVEMLMEVQNNERTVIEFINRGGEIRAMDITEHVTQLEEQVNDDG